MLTEIRSFLDVVLTAEPTSIAALVRALDALALAYDDAADGEPDEMEFEPARLNYEHTCTIVRSRFPQLGHYAVVNPLVLPSDETLTGDAIDDLADIAGDLSEVLHRYEAVGADDAVWHFKFGYEIHWGWHLHELRLYLNALQFRADLR